MRAAGWDSDSPPKLVFRPEAQPGRDVPIRKTSGRAHGPHNYYGLGVRLAGALTAK